MGFVPWVRCHESFGYRCMRKIAPFFNRATWMKRRRGVNFFSVVEAQFEFGGSFGEILSLARLRQNSVRYGSGRSTPYCTLYCVVDSACNLHSWFSATSYLLSYVELTTKNSLIGCANKTDETCHRPEAFYVQGVSYCTVIGNSNTEHPLR